jgi:hypothetical protein
LRTQKLVSLVLFASIVVNIAGCGNKRVEPTIYPNEHSRRGGPDQLERDLDECNALADRYAQDRDTLTDAARQGLTGAVIGSAGGALGGVIMGGNVGRSVGAGAAIGAIIPILQIIINSAISPDSSPNRETFVRYCLRDRGYQVP